MRPTRKCEFCGKTFVPRSGMQKYCSEECQAEAKRLRKKRQQDLINGIEPIMDLQHQEYLTFSKAAILMGCTRQYIYKLVANGKLKASRLSSRNADHSKVTMQRRHIRFTWWLQWLCRPTYNLGRNTKGRAWKRSTKERRKYVVLKKNLGTMEISNKSVQLYRRGAHFCLERLTDFHKLEIFT